MIEDELRSLLTDRADDVPDKAARVGEVHTRIAGIRRRRTAATTLALVLIAAAGVLLTRLPGRPETLPAGVPSGPYFDGSTPDSVPGYRGQQFFTFSGDATWSAAYRAPDIVVVARCENRGDLTLRNVSGAGESRLSCRVPVGDHYEGALPLAQDRATALLADGPGANVSVRPGSTGSWTVGVLEPLYPEHLTAAELKGALLSGYDTRASLTATVPAGSPANGLAISIVCVRDVRLEFLVSGGTLATAACTDEANSGLIGSVTVPVTDGTLTALGLRPGQPATIDVRSTGRQTDEWAVLSVS